MGVFNDLLLNFTSSNFNIFIASKVFAKTEEGYWGVEVVGVDITPIRLGLLGLKGIMQMEKSSTSNQLFLLRSWYWAKV